MAQQCANDHAPQTQITNANELTVTPMCGSRNAGAVVGSSRWRSGWSCIDDWQHRQIVRFVFRVGRRPWPANARTHATIA
eukprot:2203384-Prymnesium_polylepis.2